MGAKRAILGGLVASLVAVVALIWQAGRPAALRELGPERAAVATTPLASSAELVDPARALTPANPPPAPFTESAAESGRRLTRAGHELAIHAVDTAQRSLAGARVRIEWGRHARAGQTDASGHARIAVPRGVDAWRVRVTAEGFVESTELGRERDGTEVALQVVLDRAVAFRGRAVDSDTGAPIPGAQVRCPSPRSDAVEEQTTDAHGGFVLTVPESRRLRIAVQAEGYAEDVNWHSAEDGAVADGLVFELTPLLPGAFSALVVDALTGEPIEGARLRRVTSRGRESFARSDAGGRVQAALPSDWRDADLHLNVTATDYCGLVVRLRREELETGAVWTLPLLPPTGVRGIVVDGDGEPCADVKVQIRGRRGIALQPRIREQLEVAGLDRAAFGEGLQVLTAVGGAWVRTAEDGTFFVDNLVPWKKGVELEAHDGQRVSERIALDALGGPGDSAWVELVLERNAAVHGTVTLHGDAVGVVRVHWTCGEDEGYVDVDEDGAFAIRGLAPGPLVLEPRVRDSRHEGRRVYTPQVVERGRVELVLRPGEDRELELELERTLAKVAGRVTTSNGEPRVGLPLYARATDQEDPEFAAATGEDGHYEFYVEATGGPYDVSLRHDGRWETRTGVYPRDASVDFEVPAGRAVRLRVRASDSGDALDQYYVSIRAAGEDAYRLVATAAGRDRDEDGFRVFEVSADTDALLVHYEPDGYRPATLDDLGGRSFDVELQPGTFVDLRLASGTGPFPEDCAVYLVEAEAEFEPPAEPGGESLRARIDGYTDYVQRQRRVRFDRGPAVRIEGLVPGDYRLVTGGGLHVHPQEFEVGPGGADVELSWSR